MITSIKRLLVANRGEIAIRIFRAATELKMRTIAIYTFEDRYSLHRYKADEAYQIGPNEEPLKPYLDVDEIIHVAKKVGADAIHPGYGFLSENVRLATRCQEEGLIFVGPSPEIMDKLGNKTAAKIIAKAAKVPTIPDSPVIAEYEEALKVSREIGFPVMVKAASGGGGRGMRVVMEEGDLKKAFAEAAGEAKKAFGDPSVFIEKFLAQPKHIEVQLLGDKYGNLVHLYERDCSVQRRFQKVVEVAPAQGLNAGVRTEILNYALAIGKEVGYYNAGTVEFLVEPNGEVFFIEVNPRIQVEHTITEEVTGIDIVRSQLLVAQGYALNSPEVGIANQESITVNGHAIQCRITTEDPENDFTPDYGTIIAYRNAAGMGIRLDEGSSYPGVKISPFFDSMLVKVSAWGQSHDEACHRMLRALDEFRIRGVKTNIPFLRNVIQHPEFIEGTQKVTFIKQYPELLKVRRGKDRATKILRYLGEVIVNGHPDVKKVDDSKVFREPKIPGFSKYQSIPDGTKTKLNELGPEKFMTWLRDNPKVLYTDTILRDAHQSLLATRMRTYDMMQVAESFARNHPEVFSVEMWGGATYDVCLRFLHEDPWERLRLLREAMPNILTQMLLRASNAVGYKAYPDNLVEQFIEEAWKNGMDVFRIFDSLNWTENLKVSTVAVRERTQALAEVCICYSGDISDPRKTKYTLQYYLDLAKKIEDMGAHILGIKDMAGLLKPYAAEELIGRLRETVSLPIHLHTHDTAGIQSATYLKAVEAGVDVLDVALGSMSGLTSQPSFNGMVAMLQGHPRSSDTDLKKLNEFSNYWEDVREYYYPFETELKAGTAQVYDHEIPGGQYSNLRPQARGLGIEDKFELIKLNYQAANQLLGDLVKVTPSSKVVGDLAMFMTTNGFNTQDILDKGEEMSFPDSVIGLLKGEIGQPYQGFPKDVQKIILKKQKPYTDRPNEHLEPIEFDKGFTDFQEEFGKQASFTDYLSYLLYPKVFADFHAFEKQYGDLSKLPTRPFFFGLNEGDEILVEIGTGKTVIIQYLNIGKADEQGMRNVHFKLNGQNRFIAIKDNSVKTEGTSHEKVSKDTHVGAPMQGKLVQILVAEGDKVDKNEPLFVLEAMKMESTIVAAKAGKVSKIVLSEGTMVMQDDLVIALEE